MGPTIAHWPLTAFEKGEHMLEYSTLKAIAVPSRFFFASPALFGLNLMLFGFLIIPIVIFNLNAIFIFVALVMGHFIAMKKTAEDIHATTILRSWIRTRGKLRNRAPVSSGRKYTS